MRARHQAKSRALAVLQLEQEMQASSVIALQEMSKDWTGAFIALCQDRGYTYIPSLYGKKFNGYMGVGIAVPNSKFRILSCDIQRIADTREWARSAPAPEPAAKRVIMWPLRFMRGLLSFLYRALFSSPAVPRQKQQWTDEESWREAVTRSNEMVSVRLQDRETGGVLCVSNYHMPCVFWAPAVMMIHTALSAAHAQVWVSANCPWHPWRPGLRPVMLPPLT